MAQDEVVDPQVRLEERRLALQEEMERERLRLEQHRYQHEASFIRAHLGVLVTALISVATIAVSFVQFEIATIKADEDALARRNQEAAVFRAQQDEWRLNVLRYLTDHRAEIYSTDPKVRDQVRAVLEATLPHDILVNVLSELAESSTAPEGANTWSFQTLYSWVEVGVDDCDGNDVEPRSEEPTPLAQRCDAGFADQIAVCWDENPYRNGPGTWCTYKTLKPDECAEGSAPGRMYQCVAEVVRARK